MKILFISKNPLDDYSIRNQLKALCENDSLVIHHSNHTASQFIDNNIISNQLPIDLIITQNNIGGFKGTDFIEKIKLDKTRTYSKRDFNFHSLPVTLIADSGENAKAFSSHPFSEAFDDTGIDKLNLRVNEIRNSAKE